MCDAQVGTRPLGRITAYARIGLSLESRIAPAKRRPRNPRGRLVTVTDFCLLMYSFSVCPVETPLDSCSHRNMTYRTRLAKIIMGRFLPN